MVGPSPDCGPGPAQRRADLRHRTTAVLQRLVRRRRRGDPGDDARTSHLRTNGIGLLLSGPVRTALAVVSAALPSDRESLDAGRHRARARHWLVLVHRLVADHAVLLRGHPDRVVVFSKAVARAPEPGPRIRAAAARSGALDRASPGNAGRY